MIRHHYTLDHIARELTSILATGKLIEAWTQEKYKVSMVFAIGDELRTFLFDTSPNGGVCSEQPQLRRARSNTLDVFRSAWGESVALVTKHPDDRVLTIWLTTHHIQCEYFSSGNGNILCTVDGVVVEALRDAGTRCDKRYEIVAPERTPLWSNPALTVQQSLARCPLLLGPWYAEEVCLRASIAPTKLVGEVIHEERESAERLAQELHDTCVSTDAYVILGRGDVRLLSLVRLTNWEVISTHQSVLEASRVVLRERYRMDALRSTRQQAIRSTTAELDRATRTLAAITSDLVRDARSSRYRAWADILLTYPHQHERDRTSIDLPDHSGTLVTIPLNPAHSIIENATRLYSKARAAEAAASHREQRVPELQRTIDNLRARLAQIEGAASTQELEALLPQRMNQNDEQPRDEAGGRFRFFAIDEQHTLYVGKNAANNDELTMKFAKQNDWWFHARGSAGSHAVLRGVEGDRIPKPVLEQAAAITAYYSQARNASWVSVVYTQKKHVRKPKGANVGAVVLEREQTVMVKPGIPT